MGNCTSQKRTQIRLQAVQSQQKDVAINSNEPIISRHTAQFVEPINQNECVDIVDTHPQIQYSIEHIDQLQVCESLFQDMLKDKQQIKISSPTSQQNNDSPSKENNLIQLDHETYYSFQQNCFPQLTSFPRQDSILQTEFNYDYQLANDDEVQDIYEGAITEPNFSSNLLKHGCQTLREQNLNVNKQQVKTQPGMNKHKQKKLSIDCDQANFENIEIYFKKLERKQL